MQPSLEAHTQASDDPEVRAALEACRGMIRKGSKSFSLASLLFSERTQEAAFSLYGWCRHCDDQVDEASDDSTRNARLEELRWATSGAFGVQSDGSSKARVSTLSVFVALRHVAGRYGIPEAYARDLIEGMAMDARGERYESLSELELYAYRVAGAVGLMMSHIMGVSDVRALRHACDLGIAMQLSNIARDVLADAALGRVYLPLSWLREEGIPDPTPASVADPDQRDRVARVVGRLLEAADQRYRSGNQGLPYLAWRSALACSAASSVYCQIGHAVRRRGKRAWDRRTVVPTGLKLLALARGVFRVFLTIPSRLARPWSRVQLPGTWRYTS